jgi:predicted nucleic acid-binding Zn ribbon protein
MVHPLDYRPVNSPFPIPPPPGAVRIVCHNWPTCGCSDDCTQRIPEESPRARRILIGLMIAVAVIGAGLLYAGLR